MTGEVEPRGGSMRRSTIGGAHEQQSIRKIFRITSAVGVFKP
jgi:hypothetical protein